MKHLITAVALVLAAPASAGTFGPYSELLVFGDSLSDAGNLARLTDGIRPNPTVYPNGQFTNGNTWATQLGADLGDPKTGEAWTNFAFGSARATDNGDFIPDFAAQIGLFQTVAPSVGDNPLAAVWFGGNDLRDLSVDIFTAAATTPDPVEFFAAANALAQAKAAEIAGSIASGVFELATKSGIDDFLVFNAPDLSTAPALVGTENAPLFLSVVNGTNAAIQFAVGQVVASLENINPINVEFFDPNLVAAEIFANPKEYGLDPALLTSQCLSETSNCGADNASNYYFFDDIHPTEAVHTAIADAVRAQVVPLPGGMSLALGGIALLGFAARRKRAA